MSKQQQKESIRIHQINNFKNKKEMMDFANAESQKLQSNKKELTKVKGRSQGGLNRLQTNINKTKLQENKNYQKKNGEDFQDKLENYTSVFIESFKSMILQKYQIKYQDSINLSSPKVQKSHVSQEYSIQNISRINKSESDKQFRKIVKKKQTQQKEQQQLELLQQQKNQEKEQIQKQIENESTIFNSQNQELQLKNIKMIEYQRILGEKIEQLNQQIQEQNPDFNIKLKNEFLQKKINILNNKIERIEYNIVQVDDNFEAYVKNLNNKLINLDQQLNPNKQCTLQQSNDQSKKVISRQHNLEKFKQQNGKQQPNSQLEELTQTYKQEKQKLLQEYPDKEKFYQDQKKYFLNQQDQIKGLIKDLEQEIYENKIIEQNLTSKLNLLNIYSQQLQECEKKQFNTEEQIRQIQQEFQNIILQHQNQITISEKQLIEIKEQIKNLAYLEKINYQSSKTEYLVKIYNLDQNSIKIDDLIELYKYNSLEKDLQTYDEIININNEDETILKLELFKITFQKTSKIRNSLYQTKWITEESLLSLDQLNNNSLVIFEENQQNSFFLTSDLINGFAEQLQMKDEAYYFKLKSNLRLFYPRLCILPSCFLEEFRQYFKQNKNLCIKLIIDYFEDFQAIQYQFQIIYQKIAFIIKEGSLYYVITVDLKNLLVIIYNSIPKPSQQYYELQLCLNYLFSQLLKENIQFQLHVSPTFPIQSDQYNENLTGYYACIALQYFSKNQINKNYLEINEITQQIGQINLKRNIQSRILQREQLERILDIKN